MRRRDFIAAVGGAAAAWPLTARGQQGERMRRVGILMLGDESDADQQDRVKTFRAELERLGWAEGRHIRIDVRFAAADAERIRSHSDDFIAQKPDAILANGTPILEALQRRSRTVPIVFVGVSDPLSAGFVSSMARPGGELVRAGRRGPADPCRSGRRRWRRYDGRRGRVARRSARDRASHHLRENARAARSSHRAGARRRWICSTRIGQNKGAAGARHRAAD